MSAEAITRWVIHCDVDGCWSDPIEGDEYDYTGPDDIAEAEYWGIEMNINGDIHEYVCGGCVDELRQCDWCDNGEYAWTEDMYYCFDSLVNPEHEECAHELHEVAWKSNPGQFDGRECVECGHQLRGMFDVHTMKRRVRFDIREVKEPING